MQRQQGLHHRGSVVLIVAGADGLPSVERYDFVLVGADPFRNKADQGLPLFAGWPAFERAYEEVDVVADAQLISSPRPQGTSLLRNHKTLAWLDLPPDLTTRLRL